MKDPLSKIDQKIIQLKEKREKLQTQQALTFLKDAQTIFADEFSVELALTILSNSWNSSSDKQKEEWKQTTLTFLRPTQKSRKKDLKIAATNS